MLAISKKLPKANVQIFIANDLYSTIYEMAAAYAYHIIKDHPFVGGNKRTGLMVAVLFLEYNEQFINFAPGQLYNLGVRIATSTITVSEISRVLESYAR